MSEDEELRRAFAAWRTETEAAAPKFNELLSREGPGSRRADARATWRGRAAVFAATAVGLAALGFFLRLGTPSAPPEGSPETPPLLAWKASTDFLLDAPGRELMQSVPELVDPAIRTLFSAERVARAAGGLVQPGEALVKILLAVCLLLIPAWSAAEPAAPAPVDELAQSLFPPDLVLRHRQDLALDDDQSKALKELVQQAQTRFVDLQWDLQAEAGKLAQLLRASKIEEGAAIAQADRVLTLERDVKKAQLSLLIRIKNLLTSAQQDKLTALRGKSP